MVTILGTSVPVQRILTGLYSFDRAFINREGEIGFPIGKGIEIYGATFCGKSTMTYGLAGIVAHRIQKDIALADFEGFDPNFLASVLDNTGFDSKIYCIQEEDDESALDKLLSKLREKEYGVGILDSIGAISPVAEAEGELGEANMGKRAFLMAQFTRKALKLMRSGDSKTVFMINHAYPRIGGRGKDTPGGEVKKYLASIRIEVKRKFVKGSYEEFPDGSYILQGEVVKNRWGLKDHTFDLFMLSGKGIHLGLTAMYDCLSLGIATKARTIKMDGTTFGTMKEVVMKAHAGDQLFFLPFAKALDAYAFDQHPNETIPDEGIEDDTDSDEV